MRLAENVAFEVPPGQSTTKTVEVVTRTEHNRDKWWSQPGVDLQPELQLVEGPLVVNNGRASIDILVHGNVKLPAGARVAEARREQKADAKLIQIVTAERGKQKEQFLRMDECRRTLARGQAEERLEHQIKTGELSEEMQARLWEHVERLARAFVKGTRLRTNLVPDVPRDGRELLVDPLP